MESSTMHLHHAFVTFIKQLRCNNKCNFYKLSFQGGNINPDNIRYTHDDQTNNENKTEFKN